jgi:hypothetical protein
MKIMEEIKIALWPELPIPDMIMLRNIAIDGENIGTVKKIDYGKTLITITAERRI